MRTKFSFLLFLFSLIQLQSQAGLDQILKRSSTDLGIDYKHLKLNEASFVQAVDAFVGHEMMAQSIEAQVAAHINAYNLIVLREITKSYPISSVKKDARFFDKKHSVFGQEKSLNEIEKGILTLKKDPRIHFLLVCGAKSCPMLSQELIFMGNLEEQLDKATQLAMESPHMVRINDDKKEIKANAIFSWFANDFGGDPKAFITKYFPNKDLTDYKIGMQNYDWSLNSIAPVTATTKRYIATRLYNKGEFEIHMFNNYYRQTASGGGFDREDFFTILTAATIGITNRINIGLGFKTRSVYMLMNGNGDFFPALEFRNEGKIFAPSGFNPVNTRTGITAYYGFVRYAPFADHSNISIAHTLFVPNGDDLEGNDRKGYIDWDNISIFNQLFYTKPLGLHRELFMDIGLQVENAGKHLFNGSETNGFTQIGFPVTAILNYFPKGNFTIYGLVNVAPRLTISSNGSKTYGANAFGQLGGGMKYIIGSNFEVEALFTFFEDTTPSRNAQTYNIGLRYIHR